VEGIAVTTGPGSFTGLRVGVMTAKTLAYALNRPCMGANTLDVVASQAAATSLPDGTRLWVIMDAQRRQLFAAAYQSLGGVFSPLRATHVIDQSAWLANLQSGETVTGPGVTAIRSRVPEGLGVQFVDQTHWQPNAVAVARLAHQQFTTGKQTDAWNLMPQYYRLSAAEEKARSSSPAV
jgi:tRNA threonylcarbamoyladenosine biosynthesis protein TsaB